MKKKLMLTLIVVAFVVGPVWALPTWNHGDPGTTYQNWYFDTYAGDPAHIAPDMYVNSYGTVEAAVTYSGTFGTAPVWNNGVWSGTSINFTATIPNTPINNPDSYKYVVVDIGFKGNINLANIITGTEPFTLLSHVESTYMIGSEVWTNVREYYYISPNPATENLCIALSVFGGTETQYLDYVTVDTLCAVPVPGAVILGSIGVGFVGWMKRRRSL